MTIMKCPQCNSDQQRVLVHVHGAENKVTSYQCKSCDYFEFESKSSARVIDELRRHPLKIRHKIVKLSKDRLGLYFNSNIIRSLGLRCGEEVSVSVPDKHHVIIELEH